MGLFHGYVKLPEGICLKTVQPVTPWLQVCRVAAVAPNVAAKLRSDLVWVQPSYARLHWTSLKKGRPSSLGIIFPSMVENKTAWNLKSQSLITNMRWKHCAKQHLQKAQERRQWWLVMMLYDVIFLWNLEGATWCENSQAWSRLFTLSHPLTKGHMNAQMISWYQLWLTIIQDPWALFSWLNIVLKAMP